MGKKKEKAGIIKINWIIITYLIRKSWRLKKFFATMLLSFCIAVPMTTHYTLTHPVEASVFLAEVGVLGAKAKGEIKKTTEKPINYAYKKTPKPIKKFYNKNIRAHHAYSANLLDSYGISVYKPKKTIAGKIGTGMQKIFNFGVKTALSPLKLFV